MISKIFYKIDVRKLGSKNSGATNVHRTIGLKPGIIVLILDIIKGFIPKERLNIDNVIDKVE